MNQFGPPGGGGGGNWNFEQQFQQHATQLQQQFQRFAGQQRQEVNARLTNLDRSLQDLSAIARAMSAVRTPYYDNTVPADPRIVRIEDIPGRRIPFDFLVEIPIGANVTSEQQQSLSISMDGPFVAEKRVMAFLSQHQFQVEVAAGVAPTFPGRSFGRFRPIHSAWDLLDAQQNSMIDVGSWFNYLSVEAGAPTGVAAQVPAFPSSMSSFRTMEFDARVQFINAGSSFPRQNISVPSTMWTTSINSPWSLGSLDFFERGEVLTFRVQPTHANNPPFGNVDGSAIFPVPPFVAPGWPFLDGQFDPHEGIATPGGFTRPVDGQIPISLTTDPIQRLPDGIVIIGFHGYRIQQVPGPVP